MLTILIAYLITGILVATWNTKIKGLPTQGILATYILAVLLWPVLLYIILGDRK